VSVIRDEELFIKMKGIQESYPMYTRKMFREKVLKGMTFQQFINTSFGNKLLTTAALASGMEKEEFFVSLSRGFLPDKNFLSKFRLNPCAPLLSFIYQRMESFDYKQFDKDMSKYKVSSQSLIY
jgi:hypothetical protein